MTSKRRFAEDTSVSVGKSQAEIKDMIQRYGCSHFAFMESDAGAQIAFRAKDRNVLFRLPLPDPAAPEFTVGYPPSGSRSYKVKLAPDQARAKWEQACRRSWRALALVIKAKLEAVASGIVTFEDEFLAYTMKPDGETIGDWAKRELPGVLEGRPMPPLLPGPK